MASKLSPTELYLIAVGENVRRYRLKRGYTLEALGLDIGLDKGNMHKIEAGKNVTVLTLLKISSFLEVDPQKLIETDVKLSMDHMENFVAGKKRQKRRAKRK